MAALLSVADVGIRAALSPIGLNRYALRQIGGLGAFEVLLNGAVVANLYPPTLDIRTWAICVDPNRFAIHDDLPAPLRHFHEAFDAFHEACSFLAIADAPLPPVSAIQNLSEAA